MRSLILLLLFAVAAPVYGQPAPNRAEDVKRILATLPPATESLTDDARRTTLFEIARQLDARDCCWGVLVKTDQGNKIPADILVWRPTLEHFDVLTGGIATATWIPKGVVPSAAWIWQGVQGPPTPIPTPPPVPVPVFDPTPLLHRLDAIEAALLELDARERADVDANRNEHRQDNGVLMHTIERLDTTLQGLGCHAYANFGRFGKASVGCQIVLPEAK